jgi:hypothetical protein
MLHKKDIIDFIKRYDENFGIEDNIYYAEKAFKTLSVINYLGKMKDNDKLNYQEAEQVFSLLIKYLRGEADVIWDQGKIMFKLIEGVENGEQ